MANAKAAILWAGLIAGTLDISDAFIFYGLRGVSPIRILHSVASGLLGPASFKGGLATAALGLALHFLIATIWATVFYIASRQLPFLTRYAVPCGLAYGAIVYVFMNYVVVPLSNAAKGHPSGISLVNAVLAIVLCIGLPIALVVRRYS